jgi:hypothetical protein
MVRNTSFGRLIEQLHVNRAGRADVGATRRRTVVIIGAGVSNVADGLPLGGELANILEEEVCQGCPDKLSRLENEINKLGEKHDISDKRNFRTIAFSLSHIDRPKTVEVVKARLASNMTSDLCYNKLASLFKNEYIDAIINFNFDEILDNTIRQNFQGFNYLRITSDDNCPTTVQPLLNRKGKYWLPIYVKPHGTLSEEHSLRFARTDNYRFQPRTAQVMRELFSGGPVTIIAIGFKLKFREFTDLISAQADAESELFLIDKEEDILDPTMLAIYKGSFIKVCNHITLDHILESISLPYGADGHHQC